MSNESMRKALRTMAREQRRQLERAQLPATGLRSARATRASRGGCGPHCGHTGPSTIYHCPCKQCHGG